MKLIIGSDSLHPPLTGIGRYTYELCVRFLEHPEVEQILGFDLGHIHDLRERIDALAGPGGGEELSTLGRATLALRRRLADSVLVMRAYEVYANQLSSRRLQRYPEAVFHSPNYHLPPGHAHSVVTVHDMSHVLHPEYHPAARMAWMQRVVPVAVRAAAQIICVSESTRQDLLAAHDVDPSRVTVTPLGVDPAFTPGDAAERAPLLRELALEEAGYFLCVGTLEPRKNIDGLLTAYLALPASLRRDLPLVLVGTPGWKCESLQARISAARDEGVRHLGFLADGQLQALYGGARAFVYPSFYEGFGLPVLEAQACGVPVISSDCSSLPEVASDVALLVNPHDPAVLAAAMERAAEDGDWRQRCRSAGLAKSAMFSWDDCAGTTLAVYRRALEAS